MNVRTLALAAALNRRRADSPASTAWVQQIADAVGCEPALAAIGAASKVRKNRSPAKKPADPATPTVG